MKDLILLSVYCPDKERIDILKECVDSLTKFSDKYDIMINGHTYVPHEIVDKVNYVFYDKENDLIDDLDYLPSLFFKPDKKQSLKVTSTFVKEYKTFLSCYRILISGINIAKSYNYKKIHYIEYDSKFLDSKEIDENSMLLESYDSVFYKLESIFEGRFFSFNTKNLDKIYDNFNRELLLEEIKKVEFKTTEKLTEKLFTKYDRKVFIKNKIDSKTILNLSNSTQRHLNKIWAAPFYDKKNDTLCFISWNNISNDLVDIKYVINNEKNINHQLKSDNWYVDYGVMNINLVKTIEVYINDELKTHINLLDIGVEKFKRTNHN